MSEELRQAIINETDQLSDVLDTEGPLAAIDAVADVYAALDDALSELAIPRLRAISMLRREGWSYDRIAAATHLSKPRVAQLAREALQRNL